MKYRNLSFNLLALICLSLCFSTTAFIDHSASKMIAFLLQFGLLFFLANDYPLSSNTLVFCVLIFAFVAVGGIIHENPIFTIAKAVQYIIFFIFIRYFSNSTWIPGRVVIFLMLSSLVFFLAKYAVSTQFNLGLNARFKGFMFDSNYWGVLLFIMYVTIDRIRADTDRPSRILVLLAMFVTFSATVYILLFIYIAAKRLRLTRKILLVYTNILIFVLPAMAFFYLENLQAFLMGLSSSGDSGIDRFLAYKLVSLGYRLEVNVLVFELLSSSPSKFLMGFGYNVASEYLPRATHTSIFQVMFSGGVFGLIAFAILIFLSLARVKNTGSDPRVMAAFFSVLPAMYALDIVFTGLYIFFVFTLGVRRV